MIVFLDKMKTRLTCSQASTQYVIIECSRVIQPPLKCDSRRFVVFVAEFKCRNFQIIACEDSELHISGRICRIELKATEARGVRVTMVSEYEKQNKKNWQISCKFRKHTVSVSRGL